MFNMTPVPLAISAPLKEAVELKVEELNRTKELFKTHYHKNPDILAAGDNTLGRVATLLEKIKKDAPYLEKDDDLASLARYVEQAKDDRSVSEAKLVKLEKQLQQKLDVYSNRLEVSSLHVALMKEAMNGDTSVPSLSTKVEKVALEDEFEMVENELEEVFEKFEKNAFATKETDVDALEGYLSSLFEKEGAKEALARLREEIAEYGNNVIDRSQDLENGVVAWCMVDLIENGLLSDEKKKALQGYMQSSITMHELTSTLNMKSVRHWNWRNPEKGLHVTARQNVKGKYCITVDEDIIDMLFLHTLAIGWCMKLKECLKDMVAQHGIFTRNKALTIEEAEKRDYYLLPPRRVPVKKSTVCSLCHGPPPPPPPVVEVLGVPPPPMPPTMPPMRKSRKKSFPFVPPPPPPPMVGTGLANLNDERYRNYMKDFFLSRLPKQVGSTAEVTPSEQTQANLLKTLATETKLREAFDGNAYGLSANFNSFASSLPHKTIITVLKFIGVPETFLEVFTRFLEAPLNMGPVVRGTSDQVLKRTCGAPIAHGMEIFFGEAVLFFLDLAVHQNTGAYLYRLRDRCYFDGDAAQCNRASTELRDFANAMNMELVVAPCLDREPIGFLNFSVDGITPVIFTIDNDEVETYARRIKKQLAACTTIFEWVRIWNKCIGTYASHLFGPLANVFGKPHLEAVTQAYNRIHEIIFEGSNLTDHVKALLEIHCGGRLTDPPFAPEPLIYLPTAYGGLGVKNPYVTLNLARNIHENPNQEIEDYLELEKTYYKFAEENFAAYTPETREQKLQSIFNKNEKRIAAALGPDHDLSTFMKLEELTAVRERAPYPFISRPYPAPNPFLPCPDLLDTYTGLLDTPIDHIDGSEKVCDDVRRLAGSGGMKYWHKLSGEDRWVLEMYGDECFERYGGLEIWHSESVPLSVLDIVRGELSHADDDDSSYISGY